MKKILLTLTIAIASVTNILAQGIEIKKDGIIYTNSSYFTWLDITDYSGLYENNIYKILGVRIKNTGNTQKNIGLKKTILILTDSTENSFCWGASCYPAATIVSGVADNPVLAPGDSSTTTVLEYKPLGHVGETVIKYTWFNVNDVNDTATFTIHYNATPTAINELSKPASVSLYPNPANDFINVSLQQVAGPAVLVIKNMIGQQVLTVNVAPGSKNINLDLTPLEPGIYFASLQTATGIISTKKFSVN